MEDGGDANPAGEESSAAALKRESPQLAAVLKEMKAGLDAVRAKVQALAQKVKQNEYPTAEGMSYLEAKHLLLLGYSQCIVYSLLRKARGLPIRDHPVVRSLVEIRLFLEKIRPIEKKLDYQVQKLMRAAGNVVPERTVSNGDKDKEDARDGKEDPLKYRPNPDMLVSKSDQAAEDAGGMYRPPRFAPTSMNEDRISKQEKQAMRRDKELLRQAKQSAYVKELMDNFEDRPEEIREVYGAESRELTRYKAKREEHERQEEELFTRAPITKHDKKIEKHMKKSRNGLLGLTDGFFDEIRMLPLGDKEDDNNPSYVNSSNGGKTFKKRKRRH